MPEAQLAVLPGASHGVLKEQTKLCVAMIERFLLGPVPPRTRVPLRRAGRSRHPRRTEALKQRAGRLVAMLAVVPAHSRALHGAGGRH